MLMRRQKKLKLSSGSSSPIVVDQHQPKELTNPAKPWIPEFHLLETDREALVNPTGWLTDSIINAAQTLLKQANTAVSGFQDVTLGLASSFSVETGEFVQILHTGERHWNVISTIGTVHPEVNVFDSKYSSCSTQSKVQIASLLATKEPAILLKYVEVQRQLGGCDCGLFAIAYATALIKYQQPGKLVFQQNAMRAHLLNCFEQGFITMFPVMKATIRVKAEEALHVYCICRMPELPVSRWIECSECKEWFHTDSCANVDKVHVQQKKCKWLCSSCT